MGVVGLRVSYCGRRGQKFCGFDGTMAFPWKIDVDDGCIDCWRDVGTEEGGRNYMVHLRMMFMRRFWGG